MMLERPTKEINKIKESGGSLELLRTLVLKDRWRWIKAEEGLFMHGLDQDTLYECMKFSIKDTKGEERQSSNSINSPSIMEISRAILQKTKTRPTIQYIYFSPWVFTEKF